MKLVVAVVQDHDTDRLLREVAAAGLRATRLASTGGFLRSGNTTVLLGVPDALVERCVAIVRSCCRSRIDPFTAPVGGDALELDASGVAGARLGGGAVFVAAVRRFERVA
jgi:uncharacterized protein YaaQ